MTTCVSSKSIEKYVEETIIEYLQSQKDLQEFDDFDFDKINKLEEEARTAEEHQKNLHVAEEVVDDIIHDVERTITYEKQYEKIKEQHHQYALFDLADFIPQFTIDNNMTRRLCFRETLLVSNVDQPCVRGSDSVNPVAVGGLSLKIGLAQGLATRPTTTEKEIERNILDTIKQLKKELAQETPKEKESDEDKLKKYEQFLAEASSNVPSKFVVHLSSEFDLEGQSAGSRITSWVDKQFHTMEERRTEYITENDETSDQTLYVALQENKYYVKHQISKSETRKYYPLSMSKDMVGEGANFLLMRYLALAKFKGIFELSTLYINGNMCRNIYECRGARPGFVNGHSMDLCKIYRTIIEQSGIIHLSVTVLTIYGMIVSQEWEGCPYIIHINPHFVTSGKPVPYDYVALRKSWDANIEFISKYLDCKTEAEIKMKTYQKDHPEIEEIMSDYLQSVLLLKPESILPFTIDYFMSYEPYRLPDMPYFQCFDKKDSNDFW